MLVVCLSGPKQARAHVLVALQQAGLKELPADHHGAMDWAGRLNQLPSGKKPKATQACLGVLADDVDAVVRVVEPYEWVLRTHHECPPAPKVATPLARLSALEGEIAKLKAELA